MRSLTDEDLVVFTADSGDYMMTMAWATKDLVFTMTSRTLRGFGTAMGFTPSLATQKAFTSIWPTRCLLSVR